jgi:CRISPR type I-E-associated protein CasB/Cse2
MTQTEYQDPLIKHLLEHREDRALMAQLRRGLAQPFSPEVSRVVQPFLHENSPDYLEQAYFTVAPLFGLHHDEISYEGNMGSHFRQLCPPNEEIPRSVERRFMQLLACDANDLDDLLRQAVTLLKAKDVGVNWQQLLWDVRRWRWDDDRRDQVRKAWSKAFWRAEYNQQAGEGSPNQ